MLVPGTAWFRDSNSTGFAALSVCTSCRQVVDHHTTNAATHSQSLRMQVVLRLRLHFTLPLGPRCCNGRPCRALLDRYGYRWMSCNRSGQLRLRSKPLERAWAWVFREAGTRVQENVFLRDTNLPLIAADDGRRLEIVATGLPLYLGVPLGVDCTRGSPLHTDGSPWAHAAEEDGIAIKRLERDKADTHSDLVGNSSLRLTTLAMVTSGRFSKQAITVVRLISKAKARQAPEEKRQRLGEAFSSARHDVVWPPYGHAEHHQPIVISWQVGTPHWLA